MPKPQPISVHRYLLAHKGGATQAAPRFDTLPAPQKAQILKQWGEHAGQGMSDYYNAHPLPPHLEKNETP